ncbi:MAG: DUF61 family protein [Methanomassiliicoccales archaeon]|nr:MAG: DUF61 family protein [Methanomassiliicoccales archaeon]
MFDEKTLEKMFKSMNVHVPAVRPSLEEMLSMEEPSYSDKSGRTYKVDKKELLELAELVDIWDRGKLKIPILLMTDTNYEQSCWKVIGKTETALMSKLLSREPEKENEILIFYPQMVEIRRRFPTSTNVMYMP